MNAEMMTEDDLTKLAESLSGSPVTSIARHHGGGNNRIYRVETAQGPLALKQYPQPDSDPRDRMGQEFVALTFLREHGITSVPRAIAGDPARRVALYDWVRGVPVGIGSAPMPGDVDAMIDFVDRLTDLAARDGAAELAPASAHCFAAAAVTGQFDARFQRLRPAMRDIAVLKDFLEDELAPRFRTLAKRAAILYENAGIAFDAVLPLDLRTLSPSDFGFHNMLKHDDRIMFVDFEYFGWDDPVKMISDVLWHPGSTLDPALAKQFEQGATAIFSARDGDGFRQRFDALHPLYGLIWCLIMLNGFLPERATGAGEVSALLDRQLGKARAILARLDDVGA